MENSNHSSQSINNQFLPETLKRQKFFQKNVVPWLFVAPILAIYFLVIIGPSLSAFYYSLTDWNGIGQATFIGFENYKNILEDKSYLHAFQNNIVWLIYFLTIPVALALLAASFLAPIRKGGLFFRSALFIPYILPSVIVASTWGNLLQIDTGLGGIFAKIGLPSLNQAYFGQTGTALFAAAFTDSWHWWGFLMVLFLTAMQSVPAELYEAARLDGANRWQEFVYVTLPGIRPTLVFMLIMTGIWSFLAFDYVWITTQGGPAGASELLSVLVFKNAFTRFEAGYGAAIGLTMSFFAGIIVSIYVFLRRRGWEI
ncbi:MAG: sugar ABC transporter permease [Chloroflexi bacterium]|nr:sugar ABC transporter permease [Chloroflexota bacterium]